MTTKLAFEKPNAKPGSVAPTSASAISAAVEPISAEVVARCAALFAEAASLIGPVTPLQPSDIMRSLKRRKGGAQVVSDLVALCGHHGITSIGLVSVEAMAAERARATALGAIMTALSVAQKALSDASFVSESNCWQQATALYTILQRLAIMDPTLAMGLQPVRAFFQTKATKGNRREAAAKKKVKKGQEAAAKYTQDAGTEPSPSAVADSPPTASSPVAVSSVAHS